MKKLFLTIALAMTGCLAFAQKGTWFTEAAISYGMYDRAGIAHYSEILELSHSTTINGVHSEYYPTILPTFTFSCGYKIPETFVGVFLDAAWSYAYNNMEGGPSILTEREHILHLMPELKFYYLDESRIRVYATIGAGMRYRRFSETFEGSTLSNQDVRLTYQLSPFGLSVGNKWYFSVDVGAGTAWYLCRIGCGYKF